MTLDAIRWLDGTGVGLVVIDPSTGDVTMATARVGNDDARLRRAQALSILTPSGLSVAKYLIGIKLAGQAIIAEQNLSASKVASSIFELRRLVDDASSIEEVRSIEAAAASRYWSAWEEIDICFVTGDLDRVPDNWLVWEGRRSAINPGSQRNATDPVNSMLGYLYRLVEAEARLTIVAVGMDVGIGAVHSDLKGRSSLALDVMESARPLAERHLLTLLRSHPLRWRDFHEDRRGVVRVLPPLSHRLAEAMPGFATTLAPIVEHVASIFASSSPYDVVVPSKLTGQKHRAAARQRWVSGTAEHGGDQPVGPGLDGVAPRRKRRQKPRPELEAALPLPICKGCGAVLAPEPDRHRRRRAYCPTCLAARRKEVGSIMAAASQPHAEGVRNRTGRDPSRGRRGLSKRADGNKHQRTLQDEWNRKHGGEFYDTEVFRTEILPGLVDVSLNAIARATGMSTFSASKVRAGRRVPHPRHWQALQVLAND